MKNSTLILPAKFLCNMCLNDAAEDDLYQCNESIHVPTDSFKEAKHLQGKEHV